MPILPGRELPEAGEGVAAQGGQPLPRAGLRVGHALLPLRVRRRHAQLQLRVRRDQSQRCLEPWRRHCGCLQETGEYDALFNINR
jgi:hypothetical protein